MSFLQLAKDWDESKHPRHPAGAVASQGGEFAENPAVSSLVAIRNFEQEHQRMRHEHSLFVTSYDKEILEKSSGHRDRVEFTPNEVARIESWTKTDDVTMTHNHPQSFPLSWPDVKFAMEMGLKEVRAIASNGLLTALRYKNGKMPTNKFSVRETKNRYYRIYAKLIREVLGKRGAADLSTYQLYKQFPQEMARIVHESWQQMTSDPASAFEYIYQLGGGLTGSRDVKTALAKGETPDGGYRLIEPWDPDYEDEDEDDEPGAWLDEVIKYAPDQPRAPKGSEIGGQWISGALRQSLINVRSHSRTAGRGMVDTSASALKGGLMVAVANPAEQAERNYVHAFNFAVQHLQTEFSSPQQLVAFMDDIGRHMTAGMTTQLRRTFDSTQHRYTPHRDIDKALLKFAEQLIQRLKDFKNPPAVVAWAKHRFNRIHPFTDAVGRSTELLGTWVALRMGAPVPKMQLTTREEYFAAMEQGMGPFAELHARVMKFDPNQPREPAGTPIGGRWSDTGVTVDGVLYTTNSHAALEAVASNQRVVLRDTSDLYDMVLRMADDPRHFNLGLIRIEGSHLFTGESLDLGRNAMPQLSGKAVLGSISDSWPKRADGNVLGIEDQFERWLEQHGVRVEHEQVRASSLKATQQELNGGKTGQIMRAKKYGTPPLWISVDGFVVDGHHRWAAAVAVDSRDDALGGIQLPVRRVNADIRRVIELANLFVDEVGILRKIVTAKSLHPGAAWLEGIRENTSEASATDSAVVPETDGSTDFLAGVAAAAEEVAKEWDESKHPRGKTSPESTPGSFTSTGFVSPNVDENVSLTEAMARVDSARTRLLLEADQEIAELYGTQTEEVVGVGAWADGAEQALIVTGSGEFAAFRAHMALSGLLAEQKAVVAFTEDDNGPDTVYNLSSDRPLPEVHSALLAAGVEFHTLQQTAQGVNVFVFAPGTAQELENAVSRAAETLGIAEVIARSGRGEFIGSWDSREEGRIAYEAVLNEYEAAHPPRQGGWQALRNRWLPRLANVRKNWLKEITKFDPSQPRHPKGSEEGGRWVDVSIDVKTVKEGVERVSSRFPNFRGKVFGDIIDGKSLRIKGSMVNNNYRGFGLGVRMYAKLADYAHSRGIPLKSDNIVSQFATRIYEALSRRGYTVTKNPAAYLEGEGEQAVWRTTVPTAMVPGGAVFTVTKDGFLKFDPSQPRAPAGSPEGGQWVDDLLVEEGETLGGEPTITIKDPQGRGQIGAWLKDMHTLQIGHSRVKAEHRGKGLGVRLYTRLFNLAKERGLNLISDDTISAEGAKVYESLKRRGFKIEQNPKAKKFPGEQGFYTLGDDPVFTFLKWVLEKWDESQHPRQPAGDARGGEFAPKGSTGQGESVEVRQARAQALGFDTDTTWYHGTFNDFEAFSTEFANTDAYWGPGLYFSNEPEDVRMNYTNLDSPDWRTKIEARAEELQNKAGWSQSGDKLAEPVLAHEDAMEQAHQELRDHDGLVLQTYLRMKNPMDLVNGIDEEWSLDWPEDGEPTGKVMEFIEALRVAGDNAQLSAESLSDLDNTTSRLLEDTNTYPAHEIVNRTLRYMSQTYFGSGDREVLSSRELIADALIEMEYDGIIMNAGDAFSQITPPNTLHAIVFDPKNVRSIYAQFDPKHSDSADLTKFDPSQPRAPAGTPEGGQWIQEEMFGTPHPLNVDRGPGRWIEDAVEEFARLHETVPPLVKPFDPKLDPRIRLNRSRMAKTQEVFDEAVIRQDEEINAEIARDNLRKLMSEVRIKVNRETLDIIEDLVMEGDEFSNRMKTQFETNTSSGYFGHSLRAEIEDMLFGIDPDPASRPQDRPVYGALVHPLDVGGGDGAIQYGKFQVYLKDEVKARTTWTGFDSLYRDEERQPVPSPVNDPQPYSLVATSVVYTPSTYLDRLVNATQMKNVNEWSSYVEAQIHGGVTREDIAHINFPPEYREVAASRHWPTPMPDHTFLGFYEDEDGVERAKRVFDTLDKLGITYDFRDSTSQIGKDDETATDRPG